MTKKCLQQQNMFIFTKMNRIQEIGRLRGAGVQVRNLSIQNIEPLFINHLNRSLLKISKEI